MEISSVPTMMEIILAKVSDWYTSLRDLTRDGEATGSTVNTQIRKTIAIKFGWTKDFISRDGKDKPRTSFLQSSIFTMDQPACSIIPALRWGQRGKINFSWWSLWAIRVALTFGPLA